MARRSHPLFQAILPTLLLAGCSNPTGQVTLRLALPEILRDEPSADLVLTPFDVSTVKDSLSTIADMPQPDYSALEQELLNYRPRRSDELDSLQAAWLSVRRDIVQLADSLRQVGRDSPGYATAYDRLRNLHVQVTSREVELERRMAELVSAESLDLARRAVAAADSLRRWEDRAMAPLPDLLDSLSTVHGQPLVLELPDHAEISRRLPTGRWWAAMRIPHPENPFLEYYWEVPFEVNGFIPIVVPIDSHHMVVRWRH